MIDLDDVAFVNNSRETFTPTLSGAIATCTWEICRTLRDGSAGTPTVITTDAAASSYDWPRIEHVAAATVPGGMVGTALRAVRRGTGWARVGQHAYARRVLRVLRRTRPRYVICSNDPEVAVYLHDHLPDVTVLHWFHNVESCSDAFRRRYVRAERLRSVAVSRYLAHAVAHAYDVESSRVRVAVNGVDTERFHPRPHSGEQGLVTIGFVGRIAVEKAPDTLLRACLRLARTGAQFRVQIVGDTNWGHSSPGPYREQFRRLCDELRDQGIEVDTPGHVDRRRIADVLRATDVHVVPSRWDEPCGLTVIEGLATGIPVVASATGGTPELVPGTETLFPRDDEAALSEVLGRLVDDAALRCGYGGRALRRARDLTWSDTADRLVGALQ